ncbi:MAG TPA: hypothetical protein VGS19_33145 [Streptosporangiaceae bacterium]|nr:hypothetical protein [Streptosporangiaceae bacterium]
MTPQPLVLVSLQESSEALPIRWTLDCPTRGVVVLDVAVGKATSSAPLHWRAGDWTKPPLDLQLNNAGAVESIQFVFQDESVDAGESLLPSDSVIGLPVFDVQRWSPDRYMDARVAVETMRLQSGELYPAIGVDSPKRAISVTWGLRFGVDSSSQLVAIAIGPLTPDEWQLIEAAAPLAGQ